jgi:hypothetical protein
MKTQGLKKAERLFASGRYSDVIRILEPQVFMYREHPRFYYLLGMSCLRMGDFGGAYSYLSRGAQLAPDDTDALLGLAAVHVRRNETQDALRLWLEVLDVDPKNPQARRGLSLLRSAETQAEVQETFRDERLSRVLPAKPFPLRKTLLWGGGAVAVGVAVVLAFLVPWSQLLDRGAESDREGAEILQVDTAGEQLIQYTGDFRYVLTEREVERLFDDIREYFHDGQDNLARRAINRLLHSNASAELKERALLLTDYLREPGFTTFGENFPYQEVSTEPWLYEGCYVRWRGRAANVTVGDDAITFDLLVGYENEQVLEGVVPVRLDFAARVESAMSVEVIGEVIADDELTGLRGVAIRMIQPRSE